MPDKRGCQHTEFLVEISPFSFLFSQRDQKFNPSRDIKYNFDFLLSLIFIFRLFFFFFFAYTYISLISIVVDFAISSFFRNFINSIGSLKKARFLQIMIRSHYFHDQYLSSPVLAAAITLITLLFDLEILTHHFFDPIRGSYQHLF